MIGNDWDLALEDEFNKDYFLKVKDFVDREYETKMIYPPYDEIFNAFKFTPLSKVKVVILGQDPYHEAGQAHGLAFSTPDGRPIPRSLKNIFKEINAEYDYPIPESGCLEKWAKQGVLVAWMAIPALLLIITAISLKWYPLHGEKWDKIKLSIEEKHKD